MINGQNLRSTSGEPDFVGQQFFTILYSSSSLCKDELLIWFRKLLCRLANCYFKLYIPVQVALLEVEISSPYYKTKPVAQQRKFSLSSNALICENDLNLTASSPPSPQLRTHNFTRCVKFLLRTKWQILIFIMMCEPPGPCCVV
jgi:hypothetical protein